jgi:hypothetical protein
MIHILLLGVLGATACSSDDERRDAGVTVPDDSGVPPDSGEVPDTGEPPDTGVVPDAGCNPVDGTGCTDPQACVYVSSIDTEQCRNIAMPPVPHEGSCATSLHNCDVGFTCIDVGMGGTRCYKVCDPANAGVGCAGLTGMSPNYACVALQNQQMMPLKFGVCLGRGNTCVPYADQCGAGKVCSLVGMEPSCEDEGAVALGGNCMADNCARGGICIFLQGTNNPICYQPCNPQNPMLPACPMGTMCGGLQGQDFGICN